MATRLCTILDITALHYPPLFSRELLVSNPEETEETKTRSSLTWSIGLVGKTPVGKHTTPPFWVAIAILGSQKGVHPGGLRKGVASPASLSLSLLPERSHWWLSAEVARVASGDAGACDAKIRRTSAIRAFSDIFRARKRSRMTLITHSCKSPFLGCVLSCEANIARVCLCFQVSRLGALNSVNPAGYTKVEEKV